MKIPFKKDSEDQPVDPAPVDAETGKIDPEIEKAIRKVVAEREAKKAKEAKAKAEKAAKSKGKKPLFSRKKKSPPVKYRHVRNETINLHASRIMPKSDKLHFIDPKAVELPIKAVPRLKVIVENMSRPIKKNPVPWMAIGIMLVIAMVGISILYSQVIEPMQEAERQYILDYQKQCAADPEHCDLKPPASVGGSAGTGGLFKFEPPNPFAPPPSRR